MKKFFIEPDIQRLKLNLNENIASSSGCQLPDHQYKEILGGRVEGGSYAEFGALYVQYLAAGKVKELNELLTISEFANCMSWVKIYHDS